VAGEIAQHAVPAREGTDLADLLVLADETGTPAFRGLHQAAAPSPRWLSPGR
jgi:hypothetical protein